MLVLTDAYDDIDLLVWLQSIRRLHARPRDHRPEGADLGQDRRDPAGRQQPGRLPRRVPLACARRGAAWSIANSFRDGSYVLVHGDDHVLEDNDAGSGLVVRMNAGDGTFDTPVPAECKDYAKAGRTPVVVKNGKCATGALRHPPGQVDQQQGPDHRRGYYGQQPKHKASDIRADCNSSAVAVVAGNVAGLTETRVGEYTQKARLLTAAVVGPSAPAPA